MLLVSLFFLLLLPLFLLALLLFFYLLLVFLLFRRLLVLHHFSCCWFFSFFFSVFFLSLCCFFLLSCFSFFFWCFFFFSGSFFLPLALLLYCTSKKFSLQQNEVDRPFNKKHTSALDGPAFKFISAHDARGTLKSLNWLLGKSPSAEPSFSSSCLFDPAVQTTSCRKMPLQPYSVPLLRRSLPKPKKGYLRKDGIFFINASLPPLPV